MSITKREPSREKNKSIYAGKLTGRNFDDFFMTANVLPRQPER